MFIKATRVAFLKNPIYSKEKSSVFWSFGPKQTVEVRPNCTCGQSLDYIHVLYSIPSSRLLSSKVFECQEFACLATKVPHETNGTTNCKTFDEITT